MAIADLLAGFEGPNLGLHSTYVTALAAAVISYAVVLATYRLFLHPLARVPGPKIAALTTWWEVYENVWRGGHLPFELKKLHEVYADSDTYERIYRVGSGFGKDEWYYQVAFGPPTFFTVNDNAKHREGREPVSQFFSRRNVLGPMQKVVQAEVARFAGRVSTLVADKKPVPVHRCFRCITTDVITEVAWGWDDQSILKDDFAAEFHDDLATVQQAMWTRLYFPRVTRFLNLTPPKYVAMMDRAVGKFLGVMETCRNQVIRIKAETRRADYSEPPTIFHALLDEQSVIKGKKKEDLETMTGVGALIYVAAVETTAHAMTTITYSVAKDVKILKRLQQELDEAFPNPLEEMSLTKLEALPFLTAVIYEGLRLSYGVASRLPRIVPQSGFEFDKYFLPPGVQVGMSAYTVHTDEAIFPDPFTFNPDRWIGRVKQLEKYLVSFSKGSRQCIGMNLAFCEIYVTLGMLFRRYDVTVHETDDADMKVTADYFNAWSNKDARKLQIIATTR
ncbi:hypothetical protein BP5796_12677 [Coleophoma crateriformis]|uniref:Uncharacterized protein n=1 Tax=Coleophoma crateriformis TaxID=565419 RepID=A0A3D8Q6B5_9HELO|nr:hypothetical protein BP5796_12677 [Coleophoma crateriformis]